MLRRFRSYARKVYGLDRQARGLSDGARRKPRLSAGNVWLAALLMFVGAYESLHAFESDLKRRQGGEGRTKPRSAPSARSMGRVFAALSLAGLRAMLVGLVRALRRNKVSLAVTGERGLIAAAVDGHELFAGDVRHCARCCERRVKVKVKGRTEWRTEYYHRVVVCFLIDCLLPVILDVESVLPGEDEKAAAKRLLKRVLRGYARAVDVISADALYADASFIRLVLKAGKHIVIVLKDERRDLLKDAKGLRRLVRPKRWTDDGRDCRVWDLPGFAAWWPGTDVRLRVVWSEEKSARPRRGRRRRGKRVPCESVWVWLTDLAPSQASARAVWRFGHQRWHIENRCFNDAVAHWSFDHCFRHEPNAIVAFLLTLAISLLLVHAFCRLNLKPAVRHLWNALSLRRQFFRDFGTGLSWSQWLRPELVDDS